MDHLFVQLEGAEARVFEFVKETIQLLLTLLTPLIDHHFQSIRHRLRLINQATCHPMQHTIIPFWLLSRLFHLLDFVLFFEI